MVSKTATAAHAASTKRGATKAPATAPAPKKAKMDPNCRGVLEAVQMAELASPVKQMLLAAAPKAFETDKESRHFTQTAVVAMIGEAVEGVVSNMENVLSAITQEVEESEQKRSALAKDEEAKTVAVTEALAAGTAAQANLKELTESLEAAKAALKASQEAQSQGDVDFNKAKEDKAALEAIMATSLMTIVEGKAEDIAEHFEKLKPFVEVILLDDSLRSALPSSCLKKAETRGTFDSMVVQQTRTSFEERFEALRVAVEAGEPAAQERAALVAAKEAEVAEATQKVADAQQKVAEAEAAGATAAAELDAAQAALKEFMVKHSELVKVKESKSDDLDNFRNYNVACLDLLREKTAAPPPSAEPTSTAVSGGA